MNDQPPAYRSRRLRTGHRAGRWLLFGATLLAAIFAVPEFLSSYILDADGFSSNKFIFTRVILSQAWADPEPIPRPETAENINDESTDRALIGEDIDPDMMRRAAAIHRARHREVRRFYTVFPGEGALKGLRLGMSAGHGIQWDNGRWRFGRGVMDYSWGGLREDIQTNQVMIDYLLDMLERAGAETVVPRARNYGESAVIVDNDDAQGFEQEGEWQTGERAGFGGTYLSANLSGDSSANNAARPAHSAVARWRFVVEEDGDYPIFVYFTSDRAHTDRASYRIQHLGGESERTLSQAELRVEDWEPSNPSSRPPGQEAARQHNNLWHYLGTFPFEAGVSYAVELTNAGADREKIVVADAIRVGEGMGFILGENGEPSGRPRWEEASPPYLEWVGAPDWLKVNDVSGRALYGIYSGVDAYLLFHTNAGGGTGTVTYSWYDGDSTAMGNWRAGFAENELPPGTVEWGDSIHTELLRQIRARWDDDWRDRGRKGANFGELRAFRQAWYRDKSDGVSNPLAIPAALVELAFHDTDYDARFLREMNFRHDAARAILAGIIRYFRGPDALIPPLAPRAIHTRVDGDSLNIRWDAPTDSTYPNSAAESYRVYTSPDGLLFDPEPIEVPGTEISIPLFDCEPLYIRVTAVNAAGESLDSKIVGGAQAFEDGARVLYVDGVERELKTVEAPNNPRAYARIYGPAITAARPGTGFDMATRYAAAQAIAGRDYDVVIWATGESSTREGTFGAGEQEVVLELLERGTRVLVSGAEIGWDLVEKGSETDRAFFRDALGAIFVADSAQSTTVDAAEFGMGELIFGDCSRDATCILWPDVLDILPGGEEILAYPADSAGTAGAAAVESPDKNAILVGFPLETTADPEKRRNLIKNLVIRLLKDAGTHPGECPITPPAPGEDAGGEPDAGRQPDTDASQDSTDATETRDAHAEDASADSTDSIRPSPDNTQKLTDSGCACNASGSQAPNMPAGALTLLVWSSLLGVRRFFRRI